MENKELNEMDITLSLVENLKKILLESYQQNYTDKWKCHLLKMNIFEKETYTNLSVYNKGYLQGYYHALDLQLFKKKLGV
jgi:hypothetical protein